jgi:hypothetical protein
LEAQKAVLPAECEQRYFERVLCALDAVEAAVSREQACPALPRFYGDSYPPIGWEITHTGAGNHLPAVLSENIHYFTIDNTIEVPQQCKIFSISLFLYSSTQFIYITLHA